MLFSGRDRGGGLTECLLCPRLSPSLSPCRAADPCADLGAALWVGSASRWGLDPLHGGYSPPWAGRWGDVLSELTPSRPRRTAVSPQTQFLGSHGSRPGVQAAPRDLEEGPGTRFALCLPVGALFSSPRGGRRGLRVCTARGAQAPLCSWGWGRRPSSAWRWPPPAETPPGNRISLGAEVTQPTLLCVFIAASVCRGPSPGGRALAGSALGRQAARRKEAASHPGPCSSSRQGGRRAPAGRGAPSSGRQRRRPLAPGQGRADTPVTSQRAAPGGTDQGRVRISAPPLGGSLAVLEPSLRQNSL